MAGTTVIILILIALLIFQQAYIFYLENNHSKERKDLYSRLMAGTLNDYELNKASNNRPPPKSGSYFKSKAGDKEWAYSKSSELGAENNQKKR